MHYSSLSARLAITLILTTLALVSSSLTAAAQESAATRPNILWLTAEDIGPELGCYGDTYADTPTIDAFASRSLRYTRCWSTAPVCAPARTTLISGLYPTSTGSEHMRSQTRLPQGFEMYPQLLRKAGYFCTNARKEDFNLEKPGKLWDEHSDDAHWKNRASGQPFFAIFNFGQTHESRIRKRPHDAVHDPAQAPVPPYHPDTPEVRQDWAQYYDNITTLDGWIADHLADLEQAGLAEDTIVFFYGDHGSGMPRHKRSPRNSGLHVPLVVHVPEKFRDLTPEAYTPGATSDQLVGFIDLGPTVLSLAGIAPPAYYQGHAFMGTHAAQPQPYQYGFRGRMDERYDMVRTVSDGRYVYIRNYMPHKPYGQFIEYMFVTPTTAAWKAKYDAGEATPAQQQFWEAKTAEVLYDLESDPHEVNNLVDSPKHATKLRELRQAHLSWVRRTSDIGFLPEEEIHTRSAQSSPYEVARDAAAYPLENLMALAHAATSGSDADTPQLVTALQHEHSAMRYWAALGLRMREADGLNAAREDLIAAATEDASSSVRAIAAEILALYGDDAEKTAALDHLVALVQDAQDHFFPALLALNAVDAMGEEAAPQKDTIASFFELEELSTGRYKNYIGKLMRKIAVNLDIPVPEIAA